MRKDELLRRIKNLRTAYLVEGHRLLGSLSQVAEPKEASLIYQRLRDIEEFSKLLQELYTRAEPDDDQRTD